MAFVSSATLEYITCSWNRSLASHCLLSSCKKNKKQGRERDHLSFYIAGFVSRPCWVHDSLLAVKYFPAHPWKQPREGYKYQICMRCSISVTEKCFWVLKCLPCLERVCTCLTERKIHPQFCHSKRHKVHKEWDLKSLALTSSKQPLQLKPVFPSHREKQKGVGERPILPFSLPPPQKFSNTFLKPKSYASGHTIASLCFLDTP